MNIDSRAVTISGRSLHLPPDISRTLGDPRVLLLVPQPPDSLIVIAVDFHRSYWLWRLKQPLKRLLGRAPAGVLAWRGSGGEYRTEREMPAVRLLCTLAPDGQSIILVAEAFYKQTQAENWEGDFGAAWAARAAGGDHSYRRNTFRLMTQGLPIRTVMEVGCSAGYNLDLLRDVLPESLLCGLDFNAGALAVAQMRGTPAALVAGSAFRLPLTRDACDLVVACGLLCCLTASETHRALAEMARISARYVLVCDYAEAEEFGIPYRGRTDLIFARNYPRDYFPDLSEVAVVREGDLPAVTGERGFHAWLLEKRTVP